MIGDSAEAIDATFIRLLARREHSRQELLLKCRQKGFPEAEVNEVIEGLAEQGLQSDRRFAESYARQRILKGYGPLRIQHELNQKGALELNLDELIEELAGSWLDHLEAVYHRKFDSEPQMTAKEWAKRNRFLLHRGFSGHLIQLLFSRLHIQYK